MIYVGRMQGEAQRKSYKKDRKRVSEMKEGKGVLPSMFSLN
jgi:hypothetical protein